MVEVPSVRRMRPSAARMHSNPPLNRAPQRTPARTTPPSHRTRSAAPRPSAPARRTRDKVISGK
jgi:hypothetical protein